MNLSFKKIAAGLLFASIASLHLGGCATTTTNVSGQSTNRVEQIIRQYDAEVATRRGNPPITINGAFEAIRSTCAVDRNACRESCGLLPVVRQRIDGWNNAQREMWIPGTTAARLEVTWEPDVDALCGNAY